jgi:hypothetical protein
MTFCTTKEEAKALRKKNKAEGRCSCFGKTKESTTTQTVYYVQVCPSEICFRKVERERRG